MSRVPEPPPPVTLKITWVDPASASSGTEITAVEEPSF